MEIYYACKNGSNIFIKWNVNIKKSTVNQKIASHLKTTVAKIWWIPFQKTFHLGLHTEY